MQALSRGTLRTLLLTVGLAVSEGAVGQGLPGRTDELDCVVQPKVTVKLGSAEPGIVAEMLVERGDLVRKGQVIARLDSPLQVLAVELAKIKADSDVEVRSSRARLEFRRLEFERSGKLHEQKHTSTKKFEEADIEKQLADLSVETALLQLKQAKVELEQAKERVERRSIRSSVDGVVTKLSVSAGEYIYEQVSLVTVAAIDPLYVEVFVPLVYFDRMQVGATAEIDLEAPIGGTHRAKVIVIDRVFDAASKTFGVRLELPNPGNRLPAGLNCRIRFGLTGVGPAANK